jgi:hypothetical protein
MPASRVETRAVIKQREDKDDEDFTLAIQTTFEKEWQTQLQHEIQKVKQYLWQLLVPQYTSTLTENEKEAIIQAILTHLRLHEELPPDLLTDIRQHFTEINVPLPPSKLQFLNLDKLFSTSISPDDETIVSSNDEYTVNVDFPPPARRQFDHSYHSTGQLSVCGDTISRKSINLCCTLC